MNMLYIIIIAIMVWVYIYTTKDNTKILGELKWEIKKNIKNGGNISEINEKIKILEKEKQFSAWDWSHKELTKIIKASMNDPKSYEHIKTTYNDEGDSILVVTSFRWKNWFWGIVTNSMSAKFSIDGSLIEIIEPK